MSFSPNQAPVWNQVPGLVVAQPGVELGGPQLGGQRVALVVLRSQSCRDVLLAEPGAGVEPGPGPDRWEGELVAFYGRGLREQPGARGDRDDVGVVLVDPCEAPELPLDPVVVTVVVAVRRDHAGAGDLLVDLDAADHVHRERERRDPRVAEGGVLDVEGGRWRIRHARLGPE